MSRVLLLALAASLALPAAASAQTAWPEARYRPGFAWIAGPETEPGADGPVRLIPLAGGGQIVMSLNQFDAYQRAYRRELTRLALRMPVERAEGIARAAALRAVAGPVPEAVRTVRTAPLEAGALPLGLRLD